MAQTSIEEILSRHLKPKEKYIFGFADLRGLLSEKYSAFPYGISIGRKLDDEIVDKIKEGPTVDYYNHYSEINKELTSLILSINADLLQARIEAYPVPTTISPSSELFSPYIKELRYNMSHKMVATRAGLGWIGKSDLFVSRKFGTRLRLASILIKEEVTPHFRPIDRSRCGKCRLCVDACPAGAANGQLWDIHTDRDMFFDPFLCREQCGVFGRKIFGEDKRICGICIAVCPVGGTTRASHLQS